MDWLEEELKRALARTEPGPGFAGRVSAAARRSAGGPGVLSRRWLATAASLLVLAGGGIGYRWYQGVRAKDEVMLAVRLAGGKLNRVQSRVMEVAK
jgi:hypothetical protein